jgi:predicted  nucleic acid-binding Zn-ribbon protein
VSLQLTIAEFKFLISVHQQKLYKVVADYDQQLEELSRAISALESSLVPVSHVIRPLQNRHHLLSEYRTELVCYLEGLSKLFYSPHGNRIQNLRALREALQLRIADLGQQVAEMDAIAEWMLDESLQGLQPIELTRH